MTIPSDEEIRREILATEIAMKLTMEEWATFIAGAAAAYISGLSTPENETIQKLGAVIRKMHVQMDQIARVLGQDMALKYTPSEGQPS